MKKNLELVADELFGKLRTQFPQIQLGDEESNRTNDPKSARFFEFDYKRNNVSLGSVSISISDQDGLVVTYSNDIVENQPDGVKKNWFNFLRELREFSRQKFMNFETRDISKTNLDKRDYDFLSKQHGETTMTESKLWGGSKTSYQDLGETRLIIKHSQPVNTDIPAGRTMHIESIYIENAGGERFRYPHRHLNGARAMAQHIGHGGNPYDDIGQYVVSLSEEMSSLRKFKGYVSRTPVVSEAMGSINNRVIERLEEIKQEIHQLQKSTFYKTFAESFTKLESKEIPDEIVNDWIDRLTIRTFNEELKNVFPYIYKLVGEEVQPIKTLDIQDILSTSAIEETEHITRELDELQDYESYLNKIVGEGTDIFSQNAEAQKTSIEQLNSLISQEFPVGTDGNNAIESLQDIIGDKELEDIFKELADIDPEMDIRTVLKDYIKIKDEEQGTDVLSQLNFEQGSTEEPAPAPAEPAPAPAEPAPAAPAPAAPPAMPMTPGVAMEENVKRVIERAKQAGMTAEDTFTIFGEEITLADAIQRAGLDLHEFFEQEYKESGDEIVEFIKSMFDEETGKFPKGETGVMISVGKKFGEELIPKAKKIMFELSSQSEMRRIQELSGIPSTQEEGFGDELAYKAGNAVGKVQKGVRDTVSNIRQGVSDLATNFQSGQQAGQQGTLRDPGPGPGSFQTPDGSKMTQPPGTGPKMPDAVGKMPQPKPQSGQTPPNMVKGITKQDRNLRSLESSELAAMLRIAGLK